MSDNNQQDTLLDILSGMLGEMQAQTRALQAIATSNQGLWECCLAGRDGNNLLLEISMLHYKLLPDARWRMYLERLAELEGKPNTDTGGEV